MQVDELVRFYEWAEVQLEQKKIDQIYQTFVSVLANNIQQNASRQPFSIQQEALVNALGSIDFSELNNTQIDFCKTIGIARAIGEAGSTEVKRVVADYAADVATIHQKITELKNAYSSGLQRIVQIRESLRGLFKGGEVTYEQTLIRLTFKEGAEVVDLVTLQDWSKKWFIIANGLAQAVGIPQEEIRLVGAGRGSLILDLAAGYKITDLLTGILHKLLEVAEHYYKVKKMAEDVRREHLVNEALTIENRAEAIMVGAIEAIVATESNRLNIVDGGVRNGLTAAIRELRTFVEKGGGIDVAVKDPKPEQAAGPQEALALETIARIKKANLESRAMNERVVRLSAGNQDGHDGVIN